MSYSARKIQNSSKVAYQNGKTMVYKSSNGHWLCTCVLHPSGHALPVLDTLRRHAKETQYVQTEQDGK